LVPRHAPGNDKEQQVKKIVCLSALAVVIVAAGAVEARAQAPAGNPLQAGSQRMYGIVKGYVVRAADKMPEEHYAFKPTPAVRSFGQLVGHIADASYMFCSAVSGEKAPTTGSLEKTATTKADLQKALAAAFAFCDKAYAGVTDSTGTQMVKGFWGELPKLSVLDFNTAHNFEHYGNMVTYMRLKDVVPPSSEPTK
jgi:uncharacterized damage-inducible protein DinB